MREYLKNSLEVLKKGKIILYPTDTVWGIGCDATDPTAVSKVFQIKKRSESKSLVILVSSLIMLKEYVGTIPVKARKLINDIDRPVTIIYNNPKGLAKNVIASDNTVAIRVVKDRFCQQMIHKFGKPIVSTSANTSGNATPKQFLEIEPSILNAVDYVVKLKVDRSSSNPSMIVKITANGILEFLRK